MIEYIENQAQSSLKRRLAEYTLLFTADSRESFIAESRRTKHPQGVTGTYVFVSPDLLSESNYGATVLYVGEGILRGRMRRYRYHLEKGDASKRPHRDVHLGLAALVTSGQTVAVYVRESTKTEAQDEERRIERDLRPRWNK